MLLESGNVRDEHTRPDKEDVMIYWMLSLLMFASSAVGLGDKTRDRIQDRDPIQQHDQLRDGSCKTTSVVSATPIQFSA
jgi:hypothetical protein